MPKLEFQKITDTEIINIFFAVGLEIKRLLDEKKLFHSMTFHDDALVVRMQHDHEDKNGAFQIRYDELKNLPANDGLVFLHERVKHGIECVLDRDKNYQAVINQLQVLREKMAARASPVGPMHSWWDVIFDIDSVISDQPTASGKTAAELLEYCENLVSDHA